MCSFFTPFMMGERRKVFNFVGFKPIVEKLYNIFIFNEKKIKELLIKCMKGDENFLKVKIEKKCCFFINTFNRLSTSAYIFQKLKL